MTEPLRIRIPEIYDCLAEDCNAYTKDCVVQYCNKCVLDAWMSKKVTTTALPSETKVVHSTSLRRYLCG